MADTFNCPKCGAPLETDGNETSIHCEYCGETVVVPENLRKNQASTAGPAQFPTPPDQPFQPGSFSGRIDRTQIRQMMVYIRAGQLEEAARCFQQGTGASESQARQTVQMIANQLSGASRIHPEMLGALLMGAMAQSVQPGQVGQMGQMGQTFGQQPYSQPTDPSYNQPLQPVAPIRQRRRGRLGCVLALVIVAAAIYLAIRRCHRRSY